MRKNIWIVIHSISLLVCFVIMFDEVEGQQRKAFWDTDKLTNSETIYSRGGGIFIKAFPVEIKYQTDYIHIIWQLNQIFRGQVVSIVWKEVSNWDMNKKEFVVVRKEAYTKAVNPLVSIDEFTPVLVKKDTVEAK